MLARRTLPQIQKGYPLPPFFSVVVPIARTNLVTNPSVELATTGYSAVLGSIARSTTQQYHGAYSLAVTPSTNLTDGAYYTTATLTAGQLYAASCKFRGIAGISYVFSVSSTAGTPLSTYTFRATGRWQWIWVYHQETSSVARRLYILKSGSASTGVVYWDGLQLEAITAGEFVSTFIDGDQQGLIPNQFPPAYGWNGTPHASTSYRVGQTRAGGMVMRLDWYGFVLLSMVGLGLMTPTNISQSYVQLDGAQYERTQKPPRQFTLAGRFDAQQFPGLQRQISDLTSVLDRDYIGQQQPLTLLYQGVDDCGQATSDTARLICSYQGGLEGVTDNLHAEQMSAVFRMWMPAVLWDGEAGVPFGSLASVTNANAIIQRSPIGTWSALGIGADTGGAHRVWAMTIGLDKSLYAGGDFVLMGGVANTVDIARWNGTTWAALGTGSNSSVLALAIGPDGALYAGGDFTLMGGVANTARIAKWDGSVWTPLGTGGSTNAVNALVFGPDGSLYAGGSFGAMGGVANTAGIAKWDGANWTALATGLGGGPAACLAMSADGTLYAGGSFANASGVANTANIAKWNGSAWSALGTGGAGGADNYIAMAMSPAGVLYVTGDFTTIGGVSASRIASWNGVQFSPLGSGLNGVGRELMFSPDGTLYAGGSFTAAGGITLPQRLARWKGGAWGPIDVTLPGSPSVDSFASQADGTLYIGYSTTGTATVGASSTQAATNIGTAKTYPTLKITGPSSGTGRVYGITNYTTGRQISMNYTMNAGETATLVFDPVGLSFTSTFQSNIARTIMPDSNEADFFLQPGVNVVTFFADSATIGAVLTWRPAYLSVADLVS